MEEKQKVLIAYILSWLGGLMVLYGMKDNTRETKFHAAQAIVIGVGYFGISMLYGMIPLYIPFFSRILLLIYAIAIVAGIVKSNKGEDPELPLIGGIAKSIFGKTIDAQ